LSEKQLRFESRSRRLAIAVIGCAFLANGASTQSTNASLSGTVTDSSGGVVPNAELILTAEQTDTTKRFVTARDGLYRFADLQAEFTPFRYPPKGFVSSSSKASCLN
jgi:hypothetical protein